MRRTMLGFDDDMPPGAWALMPGLLLLLMAIFAYVGPPARPASYHTLLVVRGVVTEATELTSLASGRRVHVSIDTIGGAAPPAQVHVGDPGLDSARARLLALPLGERVTVQLDPITGVAWRLTRGDGEPGFGDADVSRWQYFAGGATARRRAAWLLAAGIVTLVLGFFLMARSNDRDDPLDFTPGRDRSLL